MPTFTFDVHGTFMANAPGTMTIEADTYEDAARLVLTEWLATAIDYDLDEIDLDSSLVNLRIEKVRKKDGGPEVELAMWGGDKELGEEDLVAVCAADTLATAHTKAYTFDVNAEVVANVPGRLTVHSTSFEEAVRLACAPEARAHVVLDAGRAHFATPESLDFHSVSDSSGGEPVEFSWSTLEQMLDNDDLAAVLAADQAEGAR